MKTLLLVVLLLSPPVIGGLQMPAHQWVAACLYGEQYGVDPLLLATVARFESDFREGRMGATYYGPMGIHKCFLKRWRVDLWYVNMRRGAAALSGHIKRHGLYGGLHKWNVHCTQNGHRWCKSVLKAYNSLKNKRSRFWTRLTGTKKSFVFTPRRSSRHGK